MTINLQSRRTARSASKLDLPPPFRVVTLREVGDAFAHATAIAADVGAGTLVQIGRFDMAEFAVVLEPEQQLRLARRALYVGVCALGAALTERVPPGMPISFDWPVVIRANRRLVGHVRLGWPAGVKESESPEWLVFGGTIRLKASGAAGADLQPAVTTLEDEGFDDASSDNLVASFARHLMAGFATWRERGFDAIAKNYTARLASETDQRVEVDVNGDLLRWRAGTSMAARHSLLDALSTPTRCADLKVPRKNPQSPHAANHRPDMRR